MNLNQKNEGNLTQSATNVANNPESANGNAEKKPNAKRNPLWDIIKSARNTFNNQLEKDNATKLKCIEMFIATKTKDSAKFWSDFMEQANVLLDSRKYERECLALKVDKTNLATHIAFLGKKKIIEVLLKGIANTIGNDYHLYKDKFIPKEAEQFLEETRLITDGRDRTEQEVKEPVPVQQPVSVA